MRKFTVVRKSGKGNWKPCHMAGDNGVEALGATTLDQAYAWRWRDELAKLFPNVSYAVLEVVED